MELTEIRDLFKKTEDYVGKALDDFTVPLTDGTEFILSEALKTHELVLINLWATWCPPCRAEFPFLEEAWGQYKDKVCVVALSVEAKDTMDVISKFAEQYGLTFCYAVTIGQEIDFQCSLLHELIAHL